MSLEEQCILLLTDVEDELVSTLEMELADVKKEDSELTKIERRLESILARMSEIELMEEPPMEEVEELYREFLTLTDRQSRLTDCIAMGLDTIGICESVLF